MLTAKPLNIEDLRNFLRFVMLGSFAQDIENLSLILNRLSMHFIFHTNSITSNMRNFLVLAIAMAFLAGCQSESLEVVVPQIVPQPQSIDYNLKKHFNLNSRPILLSESENANEVMIFLHEYFQSVGWASELHQSGNAQIHFKEDLAMAEEAYALTVDHEGIAIKASTSKGFFYGTQSLIQMLPADKHIALLPYMTIKDEPRFKWRGLHLDVGRHFYPVDFVKKYIDLMAFYKLNTFHWHLTEDQGWRIEIKKYPKLTEIGSQRKETIVEKNFDPYIGDATPYGGFYTQDQIREVVAYAAERQVTIVPEIEMPGHSLAALAAYPELGCAPGPYEVGTRWGVYDDIYCPSEKTFEFLEDVLTEVIDLFPGEYIHIGGDEAPKAAWKKSKLAQQVIKREGLKDEFELQSYFIKRMEKFLVSKGKKLIGWDEILEGGLAPEATVMSWRGVSGGIEAAESGHDVVMSPNADMYFDHYQADPATQRLAIGGFTTLESVYHYEPVPAELGDEHHKHVLGAQANVWTEYMKTSDYVEYMVYPRAIALSETVWTNPENKDWNKFQKKMGHQYSLLDARGVNYFIDVPEGLVDGLALGNEQTITLKTGFNNANIYYSIDGTEPDASANLYTAPIQIDLSDGPVTVKAVVVTKSGNSSVVLSAVYQKAELIGAVQPLNADDGLMASLFRRAFNSVEQMEALQGGSSEVVTSIGLPEDFPLTFGMRFQGMINVPSDGIYTFYTHSDDGSALWIHDQMVVDNDGPHGPQEVQGKIALAAGFHPLEVRYFEAGGGETLRVMMDGPEMEKQAIPSSMLKH